MEGREGGVGGREGGREGGRDDCCTYSNSWRMQSNGTTIFK